MEVRRVDGNTFDVFQGKQWGTWTRVRKGRSSAYRIAGERLSHAQLHELDSLLHPTMPIVYGQPQEQTLANCECI